MKYAVTTFFYDNGKVRRSFRKAEDDEKSYSESLHEYDKYVDIFDSYADAKKFYDEVLNA